MALIKSGEPNLGSMPEPLIRASLMQRIWNPGVENCRSETLLHDIAKTSADRELISLCYELMEEITAVRRNSMDGRWTWRHAIPDAAPEDYSICVYICHTVGCWLDDDSFYTNQNHMYWQAPSGNAVPAWTWLS